MRVSRGDPAADLPGPVPAQLGDAGRARAAARPHHRHAPGAARALARAQLTRYDICSTKHNNFKSSNAIYTKNTANDTPSRAEFAPNRAIYT